MTFHVSGVAQQEDLETGVVSFISKIRIKIFFFNRAKNLNPLGGGTIPFSNYPSFETLNILYHYFDKV